jgi:spermidine/putrescine transport system permease protein
VRTYAWIFLLRDTGLFNTALQALGIIHAPLPLLYNDGAVVGRTLHVERKPARG